MTAKNIKKKSIEGDRYYTPPWCVRQCMDYVLPSAMDFESPKTILEPGAGGGAFVMSLRETYPDAIIHANDIDPTAGPWKGAEESLHDDFLKWGVTPLDSGARYDLAVGNPPFTYAMEFVKKALDTANVVVYILRQGFMSSDKRCAFLRDEFPPSYVHIVPHRPSFTADGGTDSADYAWITWQRKRSLGKTIIRWLPSVPLEERKVKARFPRSLAA